jgi:hypothetical protein
MIKSVTAFLEVIAILGVGPAFASSEQYQDSTPQTVSVVPQLVTGGSQSYPVFGTATGPMQANVALNDVGSETLPVFNGRAIGWTAPTKARLATR